MIEHWNLLSISLKMMSFLIKEITKEVIPQEVIEQAERETIVGVPLGLNGVYLMREAGIDN